MSGSNISDLLYGLALFVNAGLFIPQAWKLYKHHSAEDFSLITFAGFNLIQFLGSINGIYHKDYALVFGQIISLITCGAVTVQILIFNFKKRAKRKSSQ